VVFGPNERCLALAAKAFSAFPLLTERLQALQKEIGEILPNIAIYREPSLWHNRKAPLADRI